MRQLLPACSRPAARYPLFWALRTAESLSCPKSIGPIGRITIFWGQQYSSCSKAGGCRAAELLGGFCRNLLIVSWVTSTPGCTANFPGNWCSQPLILRPFGRSAQELYIPVEYQVEALFINFSVSTAKKGCRQGPGSGNFGESLASPSNDFTAAVLVPKSYENHKVKNQLYMCLPPACVVTGFGFVPGFEEDRSGSSFVKNETAAITFRRCWIWHSRGRWVMTPVIAAGWSSR
jgi:hypothetical protein